MEKGELLMYLHIAACNRAHAAQLAGVSRSTIQRQLTALRVDVPPSRGVVDVERVKVVRRAKHRGVRGRTLADAFGVSPSTISRWGW